MSFVGCKIALIEATRILTLRRDNKPDLPWPDKWDLPGGGREGDETPQACVLRELHEEFGLLLPPSRLLWHREYPAMVDPTQRGHFFAGRITRDDIAAIRFGDEGQGWQMMEVATWLTQTNAVPELQRRTATAFGDLGWL